MYVKGAVPLETFNVADPVFPPLQATSVEAAIAAIGAGNPNTVEFIVAVHPFASVILTV